MTGRLLDAFAHSAARRSGAEPVSELAHALQCADTLTLQGGLMRPEEIARHARHPWLGDALRLRRWDDRAKVVGQETAPLAAWAPLLRRYLG